MKFKFLNMSGNSDTPSTDVALVRGNSSSEALIKGFDHLGAVDNFIQKNDLVFIKISFTQPFGYPANLNYDTLGKLIDLCREAGAKKVYVGDFVDVHINSESLTDTTGLSSFLESKGAKFAYLDNTEEFPHRKISLNDKQVQIPALILDADKLIILNQVNVHPLFILTLSYLNLFTIFPNKYQKIEKYERPGKDYLHLDQYKQDLISNILALSAIRHPNLVINDLFNVMEGAGPLIYKDSRCKQTNLLIMGNDLFSVDYVTLKVMGVELTESKLLLEAQDHQSGRYNPETVSVVGESILDSQLKIQRCVSKLEDINVKNCFMQAGRYCSGCFEKAYHFLNFLKSNMTKDLKYMGYFSFLIGEAPSEPDIKDEIILFGDCAMRSTMDRDFRKITIQKQQKNTKKIMQKLKKSQKTPSKTSKKKVVKNKRILELPGCPPDLNQSYKTLIRYYGKKTVPNLKLLDLINTGLIDKEK